MVSAFERNLKGRCPLTPSKPRSGDHLERVLFLNPAFDIVEPTLLTRPMELFQLVWVGGLSWLHANPSPDLHRYAVVFGGRGISSVTLSGPVTGGSQFTDLKSLLDQFCAGPPPRSDWEGLHW
jgi:hypothetical protein